MASLTVRKLDEALKASLRLRAAKAGRSVEDEVRMILREAAEPQAVKTPSGPARNQPHRARASSIHSPLVGNSPGRFGNSN